MQLVCAFVPSEELPEDNVGVAKPEPVTSTVPARPTAACCGEGRPGHVRERYRGWLSASGLVPVVSRGRSRVVLSLSTSGVAYRRAATATT